MSLWHWHKWTDWVVTDRGDVYVYGHLAGWYMTQERYCSGCGKTQVSEQARHPSAPYYRVERKAKMQRLPRKDGVRA